MSKFSVKKNIAKATTISATIYTPVEVYEKFKEQISRYSMIREKVTHHFHPLLAEFINKK